MRPLEAVNDLELQDMTSETQEAEERNKKLSVKNIDPLPTIGENDVFNEAEEQEDVPERNNNLSSSPVKSHIIRNMSLNLPTYMTMAAASCAESGKTKRLVDA